MPQGAGEDGETLLLGGVDNRGRVVRVGDTVRRPQHPSSPSVHALLRHLEARGFDGAPRFLGEDAAGREVLTYVEGDVPIQPTPEWARADSALVSVVELLRRYHDAVADFDPTPYRWRTVVPGPWRGHLVSHNDPNLDNVVLRDGRAVALIDFDLASPGSVTWDLATAARLWVPLQDPQDVASPLVDRVLDRLRLVADAYGLDAEGRRQLVLALPRTLDWGYDIVRAGAERGQRGYADHWASAEQRYLRGRAWLQGNLGLLLRAVAAD